MTWRWGALPIQLAAGLAKQLPRFSLNDGEGSFEMLLINVHKYVLVCFLLF